MLANKYSIFDPCKTDIRKSLDLECRQETDNSINSMIIEASFLTSNNTITWNSNA